MKSVFIVYYNSESSCDDTIESAHSTLEGATKWIQDYIKKNYDEWDDEELKLDNFTQSTKGVNMDGWSVGSFNIYKIPFIC